MSGIYFTSLAKWTRDNSMKKVFPTNVVRDAYENPELVASYSSYVGLWRSEEALVQRFFPKDGDLLDIGCGAGRTSIPLTQIGFRVTGIDLSSVMVDAAKLEADRLNLKIDFQQMDGRSLTFADQSFDCALFSANGIDHIPGYGQKLEALRQVFRVLKPGAPFVFSVHRMWSPTHVRRLVLGGLKMSMGKIMGFKTLEKEWGELYDLNAAIPEERYGQFLSAGKWKQALKTVGFDLVFSQSRFRLEYPTRPRRWLRKSLTSANFMFYVVRKP